MPLRDHQTFLSLYYEPNAVETATGGGDLDASVVSWEREAKRLGQVATPGPVARLMARWVMSARPQAVLDPAAGLGGLLAACRAFNRRTALVGVERDRKTLQRAKTSAPRGAKLILADYLKSDTGLFEGIIANPPYVKAHRLDYTKSDWRYFEERLGTPLDRLTNLYALFLLKIWEDLAPGGRAAILVPAEFLNANFGVAIKERLAGTIRPAAIVVFPPAVNLFPNALTTSALLFFDKNRSPRARAWLKRARSISGAEKIVEKLVSGGSFRAGEGCVDLTALPPQSKWLNMVLNGKATADPLLFPRRVGDYFVCRRGIATGANDFFCLSRPAVRQQGLTETDVEACITKAADADGLVFTRARFAELAARGRRCFLLNPVRTTPSLTRYLRWGQQHGIPQRHLPSHRPVWYLPENRAVADIWVAVFSRQSPKFILSLSGAKNLTCFHGLYAKPGWERTSPLMTLFLNSSAGRRAFSQVNRFYGDGLNKLEPKDVEAMPCPEMPKLSKAEAKQLVQMLAELDARSPEERAAQIEALAMRYFPITPPPAKPGALPLHQVQSRPLGAPRKRRGVRAS